MAELRKLIRRSIRNAGYDLIRLPPKKKNIAGMVPSWRYRFETGSADDYFIRSGYHCRVSPGVFNDTTNTDEWQQEVYQYASELAARHSLNMVCDVGCGSGYKLVEYFPDKDTIGVETPEIAAWLQRRYPDRKWISCDFSAPPAIRPELLIAADVIEHLENPDLLLDFISALAPKYIILSTPDRDLMPGGHEGPPLNPCHVREWNFTELHSYVGSRFEIAEHFISNPGQATQCILCAPK